MIVFKRVYKYETSETSSLSAQVYSGPFPTSSLSLECFFIENVYGNFSGKSSEKTIGTLKH